MNYTSDYGRIEIRPEEEHINESVGDDKTK